MGKPLNVASLLFGLSMLAVPRTLRAQCPPEWSHQFGGASILNNSIDCFAVFDVDGSGPGHPALYAAGTFTTYGNRIAKWDGISWSPLGTGLTGPNPFVAALAVFDSDDAGPALPALYACGNFTGAGGVSAHDIARWNGSSWSPLGSGLNVSAYALAVFDADGAGPIPPALFAGGSFTIAGGVSAHYIARWDGTSWSPVGTGLGADVSAMIVFDDDGSGPDLPALYAGGWFTTAGGVAAAHIAKWDGASWSPLGTGTDDIVCSLAVFDDDGAGPNPPALFAGGSFTTAGGVAADHIAKWDGAAWSSVGFHPTNITPYTVFSLTSFDEDGAGPHAPDLYAGGNFYDPANPGTRQNRIARWDGTAWSDVDFGTDDAVFATAVFDDDDGGPRPAALFVGGTFTHAGSAFSPAYRMARWDGSAWSRLDRGLHGTCNALGVFDDDAAGPGAPFLYVGGSFDFAGNLDASDLVRWDGSAWSALPSIGLFGVAALSSLDDDGPGPDARALIVGADFIGGPNFPATCIAKWDGVAWSPLGTGVGDPVHFNNRVRALAAYDDDGAGPHAWALFAGGEFAQAGGVAAARIAKFSGNSWSPLGAGMNAEVFALAVFDDDGAGPHAPALYAGGTFTTAGGIAASRIARWDGVAWSSLATGVDGAVLALDVFDDDGGGPHPAFLYAGGEFTTAGGGGANHIARWDGASWSAVGSGTSGVVWALDAFDRDGSGPTPLGLYCAGDFATAGGIRANGIARWDGVTWSALGTGFDGAFGGSQVGRALEVFEDGGMGSAPPALYVGGSFLSAGGVASSGIARWSACEPSTQAFCFGDGTGGACPCGNNGASARGCDNSAATGGAALSFTGIPSLSADTLLLTSTGELSNALSVFLQGDSQVGPLHFGDGLRCVGGALKRLYVKNAVAGTVFAPGAGDLSVSTRSAALGDAIGAGSIRLYQTYYRDANASFCPNPPGNTWNVTSGLSAVWSP